MRIKPMHACITKSKLTKNIYTNTLAIYLYLYLYIHIHTSSVLLLVLLRAGFPDFGDVSPNKPTAALTDWKGALVSISPTVAFGEPLGEPALGEGVAPGLEGEVATFGRVLI